MENYAIKPKSEVAKITGRGKKGLQILIRRLTSQGILKSVEEDEVKLYLELNYLIGKACRDYYFWKMFSKEYDKIRKEIKTIIVIKRPR